MIIVCVIELVLLITALVGIWLIKKIFDIKNEVAVELLDDQELLLAYASMDEIESKIEQWINQNGYNTIAISFERRAGKLVLDKLRRNIAEIKYFISSNAVGEIGGIDVYHPLCELPPVDLIIVLSDISKTIESIEQNNGSINIISIVELLNKWR